MKFINVNDHTYDLLKGMNQQTGMSIPDIVDDAMMALIIMVEEIHREEKDEK